jgi:hypothetical protein
MNEKIFGGTVIPDAAAEIDFEAADAGYALDPRQFRLAFLQRAVGPVAFVRDLLEMLPQPFGRFRLRQNVGTIGRGHARACSLACIFT